MTNQKVYDANTIVDYKTAKKFLNEAFGKDWHDRVDLENLYMERGTCCLLAQLSGKTYRVVCAQLFGHAVPNQSHPMRNTWPFSSRTTIDWKAKILKRRAKRSK